MTAGIQVISRFFACPRCMCLPAALALFVFFFFFAGATLFVSHGRIHDTGGER